MQEDDQAQGKVESVGSGEVGKTRRSQKVRAGEQDGSYGAQRRSRLGQVGSAALVGSGEGRCGPPQHGAWDEASWAQPCPWLDVHLGPCPSARWNLSLPVY